jgi:predicted enzyme related to lactoylglutathione lyase
MSNALNWFEIPASDINRAVKFYSTILEVELTISEMMPGFQMAMITADEGGVGGGIIQGEGYTPSADGTVVYLNAGDDLAVALGKVEAAGGKILVPKTDIGENGFFAYLLDTEGNKVGLHSMS